jgi:hypothetical protein
MSWRNLFLPSAVLKSKSRNHQQACSKEQPRRVCSSIIVFIQHLQFKVKFQFDENTWDPLQPSQQHFNYSIDISYQLNPLMRSGYCTYISPVLILKKNLHFGHTLYLWILYESWEKKKINYFQNSITRMVFVMERQHAFYQVQTKILYIVKLNLRFQDNQMENTQRN